MSVLKMQKPCEYRSNQLTDSAEIQAGTKRSLKRLCDFYGGTEQELLARIVSDLERDTLAMLPVSEQDVYFEEAA